MAFKNISLSLEAYAQLRKLKSADESFSDEVLRLTRSHKVSELAGIFSDEEAALLSKNVSDLRKRTKVREWSY